MLSQCRASENSSCAPDTFLGLLDAKTSLIPDHEGLSHSGKCKLTRVRLTHRSGTEGCWVAGAVQRAGSVTEDPRPGAGLPVFSGRRVLGHCGLWVWKVPARSGIRVHVPPAERKLGSVPGRRVSLLIRFW